MAFLECNDVIKVYTETQNEVSVAALRGIELTADKGDLIAIIGPSGSGKTTLIKMIGGIEYPSSGEIFLGGKDITKMTKRERTLFRRTRIGFLHQFPERNLLWNLSILKNTMMPMKLAGIWNHSDKKHRALELLKDVGLGNRVDHKPHQLSGGEAQRAGIAVALANDPDIILADEPTGELDSVTTYKIIKYFMQLNKTLEKTFIVVTHDDRFAKMTNRAMQIQDGRIVGLHRAIKPEKSIEEREELTFVDEHGNLRLPKDIREKAGIQDFVSIEIRNGIVCIIPPSRDLIFDGEET